MGIAASFARTMRATIAPAFNSTGEGSGGGKGALSAALSWEGWAGGGGSSLFLYDCCPFGRALWRPSKVGRFVIVDVIAPAVIVGELILVPRHRIFLCISVTMGRSRCFLDRIWVAIRCLGECN